MTLAMAKELLSYNTWANTQLVDVVSRLDQSQFSRNLGGSYPSVQATLTHMVWAEWLWLERWQDRSPKELFEPAEFPTVSDIRARWQPVRVGQEAFVASLAPDQLQRVGRYTNRKGEVWEYALWRQIYHLVSHSTYHRGQVSNMLRLLDTQPVPTDFLVFWDEER
jgi:uncharacterized damage-inducible protein DinB